MSKPIDHGFVYSTDRVDMNMAIEAIMHAQNLGLDPLQVDIFYCRAAMLNVPEVNWWHNKYARSANEYRDRMQELSLKRTALPVSVG
jgi:hypothetical protein